MTCPLCNPPEAGDFDWFEPRPINSILPFGAAPSHTGECEWGPFERRTVRLEGSGVYQLDRFLLSRCPEWTAVRVWIDGREVLCCSTDASGENLRNIMRMGPRVVVRTGAEISVDTFPFQPEGRIIGFLTPLSEFPRAHRWPQLVKLQAVGPLEPLP